jgi:hypothetical protein
MTFWLGGIVYFFTAVRQLASERYALLTSSLAPASVNA